MKILFLHGPTSKAGGLNPTVPADDGHTTLNPVLPDEDFEAAVRITQDDFDRHYPDVILVCSRRLRRSIRQAWLIRPLSCSTNHAENNRQVFGAGVLLRIP